MFRKFSKVRLDKRSKWWQNLKEGISLRNNIVHPKEYHEIQEKQIEATLTAVIECINKLFLAIHKKKLPSFNMGLDSKLIFLNEHTQAENHRGLHSSQASWKFKQQVHRVIVNNEQAIAQTKKLSLPRKR